MPPQTLLEKVKAGYDATDSAGAELPHRQVENVGKYSARTTVLAAAMELPANLEYQGSLEAATSNALSRGSPLVYPGITYLPLDVPAAGVRAVDATTGAGAIGVARPTTLYARLRNQMIAARLGVQTLPVPAGTGRIQLPLGGGTDRPYWLADGAAPPDQSGETVAPLTLEPKNVFTFLDVSLSTLRTAGEEVVRALMGDLADVLAVELDRVVFAGAGASNEPRGLLATPGVNVQALGTNGGPMTRAAAIAMELAVAANNGESNAGASLGWAASPKARAAMRAVDTTGNAGKWLWSDDDRVLGKPAFASANIPSNFTKGTSSGVCSALAFGNWSQITVVVWGGVALFRDPYSLATSGTTRLVASVAVDVGVRRPEAFSVCKDMTTS
jgi:HK97 family phage major capsid protein